eukprot:GEZU01010108.1.p1 GENE.GEZU01010108.1~~GEZU01010108.1.p1  ORF type:complete len:352 (+),score=65.67 GEZU01010108.1:162-1217(+)
MRGRYSPTSNSHQMNFRNSMFIKTVMVILFIVSVIFFLVVVRDQNYGQESARTEYDIVVIADRDVNSRTSGKDQWESLLQHGTLVRQDDGTYTVTWTSENALVGKYAEGGRGMELSELLRFNDKLYTMDDRTGLVYEIDTEKNALIPRYILPDGDGNSPKGFKCEWATEKDGKMYIGSIGKEWTTRTGEVIGYDPMYIKTIDRHGVVEHINWKDNYNALRRETGTLHPGYMVHEAVSWSKYHNRWFFLPRRVSKEPYDDQDEIIHGANIIISATADFSDIQVKTIGTLTSTRGFSSFKFFPDRPNEIVALKSEEKEGVMRTYIAVFDIDTGAVLLDEVFISDEKFEGIEFY